MGRIDSRAKYFQIKHLLAHSLGLPPRSGAVSKKIQMMYGTRKIHSGGNDLYLAQGAMQYNRAAHIRIKKQNRHIGRNNAQRATAAVCQRRCGGMCSGANLR